MKRWVVPGVIAAAGAALGGHQWAAGDQVAALIAIAAALGLSWWFHRLLRPGAHVDLDQVPTGRLVVFWKPGCLYCVRLLERFESSTGISWVNIREDPAAARIVREHNHGDELTPTVRTASGEFLSNPSPDELAHILEARWSTRGQG